MLKLQNGKIHGDNFSIAFPNGAIAEMLIDTWSADSFHVMGKSAARYYFDFDLILDRSRDMKKALIEDAARLEDRVDGEVFEVVRNGLKGAAVYFSGGVSMCYEEKYRVKIEGKCAVLSLVIWTDANDDPKAHQILLEHFREKEYAREHGLLRPIKDIMEREEVKEWLASISAEA